MVEQALELVKLGSPAGWPKTKENKARADMMGRILSSLAGVPLEQCGWCARVEVWKHLRKWLEGNGHL